MNEPEDEAVIKQVTVSAYRTGSVVSISVDDTGPGMPQKARENLFKAFRGSAAPAAPVWAGHRPNLCLPMAAPSRWSKRPSPARSSASKSRTAPSPSMASAVSRRRARRTRLPERKTRLKQNFFRFPLAFRQASL